MIESEEESSIPLVKKKLAGHKKVKNISKQSDRIQHEKRKSGRSKGNKNKPNM